MIISIAIKIIVTNFEMNQRKITDQIHEICTIVKMMVIEKWGL